MVNYYQNLFIFTLIASIICFTLSAIFICIGNLILPALLAVGVAMIFAEMSGFYYQESKFWLLTELILSEEEKDDADT